VAVDGTFGSEFSGYCFGMFRNDREYGESETRTSINVGEKRRRMLTHAKTIRYASKLTSGSVPEWLKSDLSSLQKRVGIDSLKACSSVYGATGIGLAPWTV
jgi:hypothetical protein